MSSLIFIVGGAAVALIALAVGIYLIRRDRQAAIDERLGRYTTEYGSQLSELMAVDDSSPARDARAALREVMDKAVEDRDFAKSWRIQLARADLKLTPGEFFAMHFVSVFVFFIVGYFIVFRGNVVLATLAGIAGIFAPRIYLSFRVGKRLRTFEGQLPDNLQLWVN